MNILTPQLIIDVINQGNDEYYHVIVSDDAIGYLTLLLSPYVDALENLHTYDSIKNWTEKTFAYKVLRLFAFYEHQGELEIKQHIISQLVDAIYFATNARDYTTPLGDGDYGRILTSWNIKETLEKETHTLGYNETIAKHFNIIPNKTTKTVLPVTVTIGENSYIHDMSYELVLGILAFYESLNQQHPLSLFGSTFTDYDTMIDDRIALEPVYHGFRYNVVVGTITYSFDDNDFMRGLITGALWTYINPKQYITNLTEWKSEQGTIKQTVLDYF